MVVAYLGQTRHLAHIVLSTCQADGHRERVGPAGRECWLASPRYADAGSVAPPHESSSISAYDARASVVRSS